MAYRGMATCYSNRGFIQKAREFNQKALDNAGRISDRERLLIQGRAYYLFERTYDKAIQTFEEMLRLYPAEYIALNGLGVIYANLEEDEKALAFYEQSYAIQRDNLNLTNVSASLQSLGRYEEARRICEEYLSGVSDNARIRVHLGRIALNQGRYPEAEKEAERAELLAPGDLDVAFLKSDIDYLRGRFEPAEKVLHTAIENNPPATIAFARIRLILLFQVQGRFIAVRDEFQRLVALTDELKVANLKASSLYFSSMLDANDGRLDLAQQKVDQAYLIFKEMDLWPRMRSTMTEKGILALAAGRPEEAAKISAELREFIGKSLNRKAVRFADLLEGQIELEKKRYPQAIKLLESAVAFLPFQTGITNEHASFLNSLATAYETSGNLSKARETYEKITALTMGRFMFAGLYVKAFYRLGRIAEQLGDVAAARENYGKFLDFLKNADPGIPEVKDAQKRLAGLK
jgi:tetratricopeptide (TPR) repeat protein